MRAAALIFALATTVPLALPPAARAQWTIQTPTTADLRGIDNVGAGVAWASGTNGTVLRTEDGGYLWQRCTIPPNAAPLDFRGIQAFDANTAIVMSSGKGDLSRLYKTTDGCQTWTLLFTNPDPEGFWDAIQAHIANPSVEPSCPSKTPVISGVLLGDPTVHKSNEKDTTKQPSFYLAKFNLNSSCSPDKLNPSATNVFSGPGEAAFAASNSILVQLGPGIFWIGTDREIIQYEFGPTASGRYDFASICPIDVPLQRGSPSQGMFSFAIRPGSIEPPKPIKVFHNIRCLKADIVAVGGNYAAPNDPTKTAAFTEGGNTFKPATTPPHGYRSAVAYDAPTNTWITVGPNGTDISTDDGRNWRPLQPTPGEAPDAAQHWNALSLPYAVGPHGRIGRLNPNALKSPTPPKP